MATMQQQKRPTQRLSSGKDILSRMLQMEKQSKQQRASSASPTLPLSPKADHFSESTLKTSQSPTMPPKSPSATPRSPLRPSHLPRSQTTPNLASDKESSETPKPVAKPMPLKISTDIGQEERRKQEICLSPSWSNHGEKARKKERRRAEKEQKEREKKLKQDEEHQKSVDLKAGKRLSKKPPPAAMETQKMPTALRRSSWISILTAQPSSGENSRRSSRDERRLSGMSFGSTKSKRSHSTPATSTESAPATAGASEHWHPIVSPSAPKLPSFRWSSSQKKSNDGHKSASLSDETYEKDLIAFAYRLEASELTTQAESNDPPKAKHELRDESPPKATVSAPGFSRSATEPIFMSVPYHSVHSRSPPCTPKTKSSSPKTPKAADATMTPSKKSSPDLHAKDDPPSPKNVPQSPPRPTNDGCSYVHKQRMYHQQQSIAGFEDQQAVLDATKLANELAAEREANLDKGSKTTAESDQEPQSTTSAEDPQPTIDTKSHSKNVSISSVYSKQRDRSWSPEDELRSAKPMPTNTTCLSRGADQAPTPSEEVQHNESREPSRSAQDSVAASKPNIPAGVKSDKILGFRRRTKQSPDLVTVPYGAENHVKAVPIDPVDTHSKEEPPPKRSKIERMFKEPKPPFASKERRSSSSSKSKQVLPEAKPKQRAPTSSSGANEDPTASSLPSSTTEPASDVTQPSAGLVKEDGNTDGRRAEDKIKPHKSHRPQSGTRAKSQPHVKPALETKSHTKVANTDIKSDDKLEIKASKKQAHEVVVASENGEGLIRKTSITRPRSNPQLQTQTTATNSVPSLDFLPPLKHQPLTKRDRQSPTRPALTNPTTVSISQFQESITPLPYEPPHAPDLKLIPRSPLRPPSHFPVPTGNRINRSSTDIGTVAFGKGTLADGVDAKPVAKLFVICCKCKFWHDLPSKLYEAMALPLELHKAEKGKVAGARLETAVKCPWCEHAMTTSCCQGWTTVVYLHERHH